jgi:hypothetical protein
MRRVVVCAAVLAALLAVAPAHARDEAALEAYETATLGPAHAAEHAAERKAAAAEAALTPAQRRAAERNASALELRDAPADEVGRWSRDTIDLPTFAINAVMLPTGNVAFWGRPPLVGGTRENRGDFYLWDPASGEVTAHEPPQVDLDGDGVGDVPAPLFCSGQSLLADGQLFVAGGNLGNPSYLGGDTPQWRGLDRAYTFDPWTLTWQEQPRPRHGRWYPSQVELADGRIAILAGFDEVGQGNKNIELEVFTPAAERGGIGTLDYYPAGNRDTAFYPHLFTLKDGRVFLGGPDKADSGLLDPAGLNGLVPGGAWASFTPTNQYRVGGNAILWPQGAPGDTRVTLLGGYTYDGAGGVAVKDTETFDTEAPAAGWTVNSSGIPAMNSGRSYGNVVQLPNGELVAVGGGAGKAGSADVNFTGGDQRLKQVELLRPGIDDAWRLGPAQQKWRAYHSTALLLPDGRVLSAGDDYWHLGDEPHPEGGDPMDVGEIYSPPYLFDGDELAVRPAIEDAPAELPYGAAFGIEAPGASRAVLVAPGATTHGADMNQRLVELETARAVDGVGLDVRSPEGPGAAPPGYYMLFVFDARGTPSIARWVRVTEDAPLPDTLPEPEPTATPTPTPTATPTATPTPTVTAAPLPTASPEPAPPASYAPPLTLLPPVFAQPDRTAPRATVSLARSGRRLDVRLKLSETGRAAVAIRYGARNVKRTLAFARAGATRTVTITALRGLRRLTVTVRARDAAGNQRTATRRWSTTP